MLKQTSFNKSLLFHLTVPIFLELLLQMLVGNIDKVMVGNDFSAAAINNANTVLDMLTVSLSVLSTASLILINQYKGSGDPQRESQVYVLSFYFNLALSIVISLFIFIFADPILTLIKTPAEIRSEALSYLRITGGFLFLQSMMLSLSAYLRSNALMIQSLVISVFFNLLNICGNALFLYVIGIKGAVGVAIPSTISRAVGAIVLWFSVRRHLNLNLTFLKLKGIPRSELYKLLKLGLPSCGESISYSFSQIVILSIINLIGTTAAVVKTYSSMLAMCSFLLTSAISQAMQILLGRELGASRKDEAEHLIRYVTLVSCLTSFAVSSAIFLFSRQIFGLLTDNPEVVRLCRTVMAIDIVLELGRAVNIVLVRAFQTCGDVIYPTTLAVIFCWEHAI